MFIHNVEHRGLDGRRKIDPAPGTLNPAPRTSAWSFRCGAVWSIHVRDLVEREFLTLDEREQSVRSVMAKLETGFLRRFATFQHE